MVSIFVLTSAGIIILIHSVNPNKYKPLIIASVNNNTGRNLRLDGDISWQVWPNIGLQIKKISLSNLDDFGSNNLFEIQSANLSLDLLPLFRNRIIVNDLNINGLKLNLITKKGKNNWAFSPASTSGKDSNNSSMRFDLHSFSLTNTNITYTNLDNNTKKEIKDLDFSLDNPSDGGIHFDNKTKQLNLANVNFSINKKLKGTIQLDLKNDQKLVYNGNLTLANFSLNQLLAKLNMKPININNKALLDNVSFKTDFMGNKESATISNLTLNVGQSILQGYIKINNFSPLSMTDEIRINQIELSDLVSIHDYKMPMRDISFNGVLTNLNLGIDKLAATQHLAIQNILLYGINIQSHINSAERVLTIKQISNPVQMFERLVTMISPSSYTKDLKQKTNLGKLDTQIVVRNGILTTPNFVLVGPTLKITNKGLVNLNKNYINYRTFTKIVSLPANSLLGSLTFPYIIIGNLNNPDTSLDKVSLQKQIIDYYAKMGITTGVINTIKQGADKVKKGTVNLWNKVFH
ncbi:MAG: hypothetical protein K0R14_1278 [Burkholderiales bacterium]|jgi:hypothetical protein|nr:hypothetical protein [Burkholderiales bacterium]